MRVPRLLALALLAGCAPTPSIGDSTEAIINGTADSGDPAVMMLIAQVTGTSRGAVCTATLIAPNVLLTAAHCVDPVVFQADAGAPPQVKYYVDTANSVDLTKPIDPSTLLMVQTTHFDPLFNPDPQVFVTTGHDVGVVVLQAAQTIPPVPFNHTSIDQMAPGTSARVIGYGVTSGSDTTAKTAGTKRQTTIAIQQITSLYVNFEDGSHGICEGDSGGPALVTMNGVETIIGVTAFGQQGCPVTSPSSDSRADDYASEIDCWVSEANGGPACPSGGGGGGTGGGGSAGSGGGGGSAGSAGTGGTGGTTGGGSSGCAIGGGSPAPASLLVLVLALLTVRSAARPRRRRGG